MALHTASQQGFVPTGDEFLPPGWEAVRPIPAVSSCILNSTSDAAGITGPISAPAGQVVVH